LLYVSINKYIVAVSDVVLLIPDPEQHECMKQYKKFEKLIDL